MKKYAGLYVLLSVIIFLITVSTTFPKQIELNSDKFLKINYSLLAKGMCKPGPYDGKFVLKVTFSNLPDTISFLYPIKMNLNIHEEWAIKTNIKYHDIEGERVQIELIDFHDVTNDKTQEMIGSITEFIFIKVGSNVIKHPVAKFAYREIVNLVSDKFFKWNNKDILQCSSWSGQIPYEGKCSDDIVLKDITVIKDFEKIKFKFCWE